ncbi:MAG: hypothetical protein R3F61_24035 [Myxococcota bacterium]
MSLLLMSLSLASAATLKFTGLEALSRNTDCVITGTVDRYEVSHMDDGTGVATVFLRAPSPLAGSCEVISFRMSTENLQHLTVGSGIMAFVVEDDDGRHSVISREQGLYFQRGAVVTGARGDFVFQPSCRGLDVNLVPMEIVEAVSAESEVPVVLPSTV